MNEWNAVFFFLSSFILPALYMWVYYVISVRLHEFHVAIVTGMFCPLPFPKLPAIKVDL
jgi:hypothetical protein